jgi:hypothetical protein
MKVHMVVRDRVPHMFYTIGSQMAVRLSPLRAGRPFTPRKIPGTHFCQNLSRPKGHSADGRIRSIEKSNVLIGNRTRDLPACSIVPQPITLPLAPVNCVKNKNCSNLYLLQSCCSLVVHVLLECSLTFAFMATVQVGIHIITISSLRSILYTKKKKTP